VNKAETREPGSVLSDEPPVHHEPLSALLKRLLEGEDGDAPITINLLLARTEGRGVFLLIITICLPFLLPTPFLGLSTPMGLIMMTLAMRHALELPPRLPKKVGDRVLPDGFKVRVLGGSVKMLKRLERWVRPRKDKWLSSHASRWLNCSIVAVLAFLLCLPLPPFIPFTNSVPAIAIILICLSLMEEDGVLIWFAYVAVLGNVAFFGFLVISIGKILVYWREIWELVRSHL
jgi:hypothetical protein